MIKKFALTLAIAGSLAAPVGCTQTQKVAGGAAAGAAAGQLLGRDTRSTIAGAVIGGTAAFLVTDAQDNVRKNARGECLYDPPNEPAYYAACPR